MNLLVCGQPLATGSMVYEHGILFEPNTEVNEMHAVGVSYNPRNSEIVVV